MPTPAPPPDGLASSTEAELEALRERVAALETAVQGLHDKLHPDRRIHGLAALNPLTLARRTRGFLGRTALTSRRAVWVEGRWRHRLDRGAFAGAVAATARGTLSGRRAASYDARPFTAPSGLPRPRILHVIANVAVGGSTQLLVDLANRLGNRWEMAVLASAAPPGAQGWGLPLTILPQPSSKAAVREAVAAFAPDLMHVHYWGDVDAPWYAHAFAAAERLGVPMIQNVNTPVAPHLSATVSATVYVSDYVRRAFGGGGGGGGEEIVIHPGSDFARFTPPAVADPHAADSIGMVYRLEPDKLNRDSIEPLIAVVKRRPRTRAFVIGGGSLFYPFVEAVLRAGVLENFVFTGYVPYADLPAWYARFGVFVAPVWKESFGQVTPFAMSMGLAVTGAKVGALPEILGGEEHLGDTSEEIADKTIALLDDPARRLAIGAANRERALANYSVEGMIAAYGELYGRLAPQRDPMPGWPQAETFPG